MATKPLLTIDEMAKRPCLRLTVRGIFKSKQYIVSHCIEQQNQLLTTFVYLLGQKKDLTSNLYPCKLNISLSVYYRN